MPRTEMPLQASLCKASRKQLDARVVELKKLQTRLEAREDEPTTLYDNQTKLTSKLFIVSGLRQSTKKSEPPSKRAEVVCGIEGSSSARLTAT